MPDIKDFRRRFIRIAVLLICIDVAAVAVLISPIGRGARGGQREVTRLWSQLRTKDREVLPLRDIDKKVVDATSEIASFYDKRLPDSNAVISEQLGKLAAENRVTISAGNYDTKPADIPSLTRVSVDATITGDYPQAVKFINALERDKTFFIINSVSVVDAQGGAVRLQVKLESYVRSA